MLLLTTVKVIAMLWEYILLGLSLGFSAGFSPGPLSTLIISESMLYGFENGIFVCFAPLVTDIVIVPSVLLLLSKISNTEIISFIAIAGGIYLIFWLGRKNLSFRIDNFSREEANPGSLKKGIITNFLSPSPYIFWLTIGGPIYFKGVEKSVYNGIAFIGLFYIAMIIVKIFLSFISAKSAEFIKGRAFEYSIKITGLILIGLGGYLIYTGIVGLIS